MCTAITLQAASGDTFLGRTMDFSYPLDPQLYSVPRGFRWNNLLNTCEFCCRYSFMGIGQDISPVTFADGVNEMGFSAAVLYFPGYASYDMVETDPSGRIPIAATELLRFLLAFCPSVRQAGPLLDTIRIVGIADGITHSIAPLHWIIADRSGSCSVIEKTADGLQLTDNPIGVFSNSPDFSWHMTNLRNYGNILPSQQAGAKWNSVSLIPFGQGGGTFGLPGDATPPSRFVRAAYYKSHSEPPASCEAAVSAFFHIMETVSIPKGSVLTDRLTPDYTQYTACMNLTTREYFYRSYDNNEISYARLQAHLHPAAGILPLGRLNRPTVYHPVSGG